MVLEFTQTLTDVDCFFSQGTPVWKPMPASWVVVPHKNKLQDFVRFKNDPDNRKLKPVKYIYVKFNSTETQFLYKTVPFSKRLTAPTTFSQLASRFYNTAYLLYKGLKDRSTEVIQGNDRGYKEVRLAITSSCPPLSTLLRTWEEMWN